MSKIALYISSRNNYCLLENLFLRNLSNFDYQKYKFYNVDDMSDPDEVKAGMDICERHNITFLHNKKRGLQWAAQTVIDNLPDEVEYIIWFSHDTVPLDSNFFSIIEEKIATGSLDDFGMVGFNAFGPQCNFHHPTHIPPRSCGILGRAPLMKLPLPDPSRGWFKSPYVKMPWDQWGEACTVDVPNSFCEMINVKNFKKYVVPTDKYHLFFAHDDLGLQFLKNNIYNIVLPDIRIWHQQTFKEGSGVPVRSSVANQSGDTRHFDEPEVHHLETWKDRWGWYRIDRSGFESVKEMYEGTLIYETYYHDFSKGPLKKFKI